MYSENLNLPNEIAQTLEEQVNDARDKFLDQMYDIKKESLVRTQEVIAANGNDLYELRRVFDDMAIQANEAASEYYATVRSAWETLGDIDMKPVEYANVNVDQAAYTWFGGTNNTGYPGYTYQQLANNQAEGLHPNIDDMWAEGTKKT